MNSTAIPDAWKAVLEGGKFIGEGAFGAVRKYRLSCQPGKHVAVKAVVYKACSRAQQRKLWTAYKEARDNAQNVPPELAHRLAKRARETTREYTECTKSPTLIRREMLLLESFEDEPHPNIVRLYRIHPSRKSFREDVQTIRSDKEQYIEKDIRVDFMMEMLHGGDLEVSKSVHSFATLGNETRMTEAEKEARRSQKRTGLLMVMLDGLQGLDAMHERGWVHRDLKLENIFGADPLPKRAPWYKRIDVGLHLPRLKPHEAAQCVQDLSCRYVLGDLGLACQYKNAVDKFAECTDDIGVGTPTYRAPEVILEKKRFSPPADVYSLGMTLLGAIFNADKDGKGSAAAMRVRFDEAVRGDLKSEMSVVAMLKKHNVGRSVVDMEIPGLDGIWQEWGIHRRGLLSGDDVNDLYGIGIVKLVQEMTEPRPADRPSVKEALERAWMLFAEMAGEEAAEERRQEVELDLPTCIAELPADK